MTTPSFNWAWVEASSDTKNTSDLIAQNNITIHAFRQAVNGSINSSDLTTFVRSVSQAIQRIQSDWKVYIRPIINSLPAGSSDKRWSTATSAGLPAKIDCFKYGIQGTTLFVFNDADSTKADGRYWHTDDRRPKTIAEKIEDLYQTIDAIEAPDLSTLVDLDPLYAAVGENYRNPSYVSSIGSLDSRISAYVTYFNQLNNDIYDPTNYGSAQLGTPLTYSMANILDALLKLHGSSGWNQDDPDLISHDSIVFPAHTHDFDEIINPPAVALTKDRTLPSSHLEDEIKRLRYEIQRTRGSLSWYSDASYPFGGIASLSDHISQLGGGTASSTNPHAVHYTDTGASTVFTAIRTFTGMASNADTSPAYLSTNYVSQGSDLVTAISDLDAAITGGGGTFTIDNTIIVEQGLTAIINGTRLYNAVEEANTRILDLVTDVVLVLVPPGDYDLVDNILAPLPGVVIGSLVYFSPGRIYSKAMEANSLPNIYKEATGSGPLIQLGSTYYLTVGSGKLFGLKLNNEVVDEHGIEVTTSGGKQLFSNLYISTVGTGHAITYTGTGDSSPVIAFKGQWNNVYSVSPVGSNAGFEVFATNCQGGDYSFGGSNRVDSPAEFDGVCEFCVGGHYSFGGSDVGPGRCINAVGGLTWNVLHCTGGNYSFGSSYDNTATCSCNALGCIMSGYNYCFGSTETGTSAICSGNFKDCISGDYSFGYTAGDPIYGGSAEFTGAAVFCAAGDSSFGSGGTDCSGFCVPTGPMIDCRSGNQSFGYGGLQGTCDASSYFMTRCIGSDLCFGASAKSDGSASSLCQGTFVNCEAGEYSFSGVSGGEVVASPSVCSGIYKNCTAEQYSFGGKCVCTATCYDCYATGDCFGGADYATGILGYNTPILIRTKNIERSTPLFIGGTSRIEYSHIEMYPGGGLPLGDDHPICLSEAIPATKPIISHTTLITSSNSNETIITETNTDHNVVVHHCALNTDVSSYVINAIDEGYNVVSVEVSGGIPS